MNEPLTESIQDYLKTIYDITESDGKASTTDLALRLGVAPASVTGMLQRLAGTSPPLVDYRKHQGVSLTAAGRLAALEVIRHHRLIETYLVRMLGYSWDEVHAEADKLEHAISEEFETRIATLLGNPTRDPHGELIPSGELVMPEDTNILLSSLRPTQRAVIKRVRADDPALLRHLENLNLTPGVEISLEAFSQFDHNITLRIGSNPTPVVVGPAISDRIFIELLH